jgi:acetyl-CoA carboxylase biotin carboxyl carrier protein
MTFDEIKQLLELVREHELTDFELEREGFKIRIRKHAVESLSHSVTAPIGPVAAVVPVSAPVVPATVAAAAVPPPPPAPADSADDDGEVEFAVVKSPIVGTFFRSPEPTAPPFVEVGQPVRKNQVLCIIEAMKLMNEITSEYEGELVKVFVENGQPVQYGERLFAIRAS